MVYLEILKHQILLRRLNIKYGFFHFLVASLLCGEGFLLDSGQSVL